MTRKLEIPTRAPFLKGDVVSPDWVAYFTQLGTHIRNLLVDSPESGDDGKYLFYDHTNAKFDYATPGEGHIVLFPWFRDSVGQGTWTKSMGASYLYSAIYCNADANGDNFTLKCFLSAGTYTIKLAGYRLTDAPIVDVDVDGANVASFDMYGAADGAYIFNPDTGNVVKTSGVKDIKIRVDGKNASSSNYNARISAIDFYRTA